MKKMLFTAVIMITLFMASMTTAWSQMPAGNIVNVTSLHTKWPENGSAAKRDSLVAIYNMNVTNKNDKVLSHREYAHYFTGSSTDYLVIEEYKDLASMEEAFRMSDELEKKAWPDEAKRKAFMDAMGAYFEQWHGDGLYHINAKLSQELGNLVSKEYPGSFGLPVFCFSKIINRQSKIAIMSYEFIPEENDYLNYLYYVTTKSKRVQKKRTINKMVILFIYFIIGLYLYNSQGPFTAAVFFVLCLPAYFFYNYFEKKQYRKHFTRYIQANYKDEIGVKTSVKVDSDAVSISLNETEARMPWPEIEEINETGDLILIQEKSQNAIVIPKLKVAERQDLIADLKKEAQAHAIPYVEDPNWKWK